ncbi:Hypothetical predicted protein [Pelobates cultripes]|uniref:Uncharacterized protein n=1 Tax=Pelobates cultripes TaxID=61616 RepID=A0AAD1R266_PELCU|nr:Hypothetical predicted protein [Pelobates cultripes]
MRVIVLAREYPCPRAEHTGPTRSTGRGGEAATRGKKIRPPGTRAAHEYPHDQKKHMGLLEKNSTVPELWGSKEADVVSLLKPPERHTHCQAKAEDT